MDNCLKEAEVMQHTFGLALNSRKTTCLEKTCIRGADM